ncbi:MAG: 30S ribosomal protein S2 [Candidatus Brennerbacteria bacterium]|nr:30S ribosomal protein S2 [Candidatus Brennerbacteria bacterium]
MTDTAATHEEKILEMAKLGVLFGHTKSKTHPKMRPYIGATKNEIELIDPEATIAGLAKAIEIMAGILEKRGMILMVGTVPSARAAVESFAERFSFPFVTGRWLGGTLTNFSVIAGRVKHFLDMKEKHAAKEFSRYTKKEQLKREVEVGKMARTFRGLEDFTKRPDLLFVVDARVHGTAVAEAKKMKIPVVSIIDTDDDPGVVECPIFANDHAKSSIEWVMGELTRALAPVAERIEKEVPTGVSAT